MSYNNSRNRGNYNTRNSGRFNRPGSFVPASSSMPSHQSFDVPPQFMAPPAPLPAPPSAPAFDQPMPAFKDEEDIIMNPSPVPSFDDSSSTTSTNPRLPFFKGKSMGIKKISNKERRRRQNALLRRLTSPKNALMCINEMLPNEQIANQFKVEPAPLGPFYSQGPGAHNFCAQLTLDGVTYKGFGENKLMARNAAAEQAIRDIVLKKMERYSELMSNQPDADAASTTGAAMESEAGAEGGAAGAALDTEGGEALPMIQLLSFALHKLFAEWEGAGHHVPQLRARPLAQVKVEEDEANGAVKEEPGAGGSGAGGVARPPKKPKPVPENASSMHPAMLLTVLRPHAAYRELACEGDKPQNMIFTVAVDIDEQTFTGKASNKKEARKAAARAACKALLGVTFDDEALVIPTRTSN